MEPERKGEKSVSSIDQVVIMDRLSTMEKALQELNQLLKEAESLTSYRRQLLIERCVEIIIQGILDIGAHFIARLTPERVKSYAEVIPMLARYNIISQDLASNLDGLSGLRNILVHEYFQIDVKRLETHSKDLLEDASRFVDEIRAFLNKKK